MPNEIEIFDRFGKIDIVRFSSQSMDENGNAEIVFCYQNCFDLLREKNDLVIEKNF